MLNQYRNPEELIHSLYRQLHSEVTAYSDVEAELLRDSHLYYGRYLDPRTRAHFEDVVIPKVAQGLEFLTCSSGRRVLDLGCGLGMQSIALALMGHDVVGLDIRQSSVDLCRRRVEYFEELLDRPLSLRFECRDFNRFATERWEFDFLFSMSAFSYIPPFEDTVANIGQLLKSNDAKVFLFEENSSHLVRRLSGRSEKVPQPDAVIEQFSHQGFEPRMLAGAGGVPKSCFKSNAMRSLAKCVDDRLGQSLLLSGSYVLALERSGSQRARA